MSPLLDRGVVLVLLAVAIALGATSMSDIALPAHLAPVLGTAPVCLGLGCGQLGDLPWTALWTAVPQGKQRREENVFNPGAHSPIDVWQVVVAAWADPCPDPAVGMAMVFYEAAAGLSAALAPCP
jgi:hypothetical protein